MICSSPLWTNSLFYYPTLEFITLMSNPDDNLLQKPSTNEFKSLLRLRIQNTLNERWQHLDIAEWSRQLIPNWCPNLPSTAMFSKPGSVRQMQMISGHYDCNSYLFKTKQTKSAKCRHCDYQEETTTHILLHCPKFNVQRTKLMASVRQLDLEPIIKTILTNKLLTLATQEFLAQVDIGG